MDKEKYESVKKFNPMLARIWKSAVESFPDEGLRKYFTDFDNFHDFYHKINRWFHDEEVRLSIMFDICPELKPIATKADQETANAAEAWTIEIGWI